MDYELDNIFNIIIFTLVLALVIYYTSYNNKPILDTFTNNSSYIETGTGKNRLRKRKFITNNNVNNLDAVIVNFKLDDKKYISVFRHKGIQGYKPMGYCTHVTNAPIKTDNDTFQQIMDNNQSLHLLTGHNIQPTEYVKMWHSGKMCEYKGEVFSIHRPIHSDSKYVAMGDIITKGLHTPTNVISMIPKEDLAEIDYHNGRLWHFSMEGVCEGETYENEEENPNPNNVLCNSVSGHNFFKCDSNMVGEIDGSDKHHSVKPNFMPNQSNENLVVTLKVKN